MPIDISTEANGIMVVRASGTLVKQDYAGFVPAFRQAAAGRSGKLRVLFDATHLKGWDPQAIWEEVKFDIKHLSEMERLAIVGNREWQHLMARIGNVFPHVQARYFEESQSAEAQTWLQQP